MSVVSAVMALAAAMRDKLNTMTPRLLPSGGTVGQVVTKTGPAVGAAAWQSPATAGAIQWLDAALAADVTLVANNTWYDGPSLTLPAGTWRIDVSAHYRRSATTAAGVVVRVVNGAVVIANGGASHPSLNGSELQISAFGTVTLAAEATLVLQMLTTAGSTFSAMKAQTQSSPQGNSATRMTAIRLS